MRTVCAYITKNARWKSGVLSENILAILTFRALYLQRKCSHALYVQYTRVSSCFFNAILHCRQVYFTTMSQRSCHVQNPTCSQNVVMHSMFNIQEFPAAFSTQFWSVSRCIFHWKTWNNVGLHCTECAIKHNYLFEYIAVILLCTALYLQPKCSHPLYIQYKRVKSCFFNAIL